MEHPPPDDPFYVRIPLKRFLQIAECPAPWERLDLYLFRDAHVVFYVGQSRLAFVRVWEHIVQGYKCRSVVGRFILSNWPESMKFTIELMGSQSSRFAGVEHDLNGCEHSLIEQFAPCFNEALNVHPTPVPDHYRPYNAVLKCSRNINHLIRDAGYVVKAEEKKSWLIEGSEL